MHEQAFPPDLFINRELSWLEFNARVLEEAEDRANSAVGAGEVPGDFQLEPRRIFHGPRGGFARAGVRRRRSARLQPDGLRAIAQLQRITKRTQELVAAQYRCWNESVRPALCEGRHSAADAAMS